MNDLNLIGDLFAAIIGWWIYAGLMILCLGIAAKLLRKEK